MSKHFNLNSKKKRKKLSKTIKLKLQSLITFWLQSKKNKNIKPVKLNINFSHLEKRLEIKTLKSYPIWKWSLKVHKRNLIMNWKVFIKNTFQIQKPKLLVINKVIKRICKQLKVLMIWLEILKDLEVKLETWDLRLGNIMMKVKVWPNFYKLKNNVLAITIIN